MKTVYGPFEKGHGTHEKKQIVFKNKIETDVPNINFFGEACKFCFTNKETVCESVHQTSSWFL
jgi:hypothetical protein